MKTMFFSALFFVLVFSGNILKGQDNQQAGPSDTLVVVWSSGDPEVAEKACLMYTKAAKKYKWFREVILIVWGPSQKLMVENEKIKGLIDSLVKEGVVVEACIACSNMYGITDDLKECRVDVKGMGVPLTKYLKKGYKVISY